MSGPPDDPIAANPMIPVGVSSSSHEQYTAERSLRATTYTITPDQLPEMLTHYLSRTEEKPDIAVAIWGGVGVGKTAGVRQYAKDNHYRLLVLHLQLFDPTDLKGIPIKTDDGRVRWVPWSYLPQQMTVNFVFDGEMPIQFDWPHAEHIAVDFPDDPDLYGKIKVEITRGIVRLRSESGTKIRGRVRIMEKALVFLDEISTANSDVQNAALSFVLDGVINEYSLPEASRVVAAGNTERDGAFTNPISAAFANRFAHIVLTPSVPAFLTYAMENRFRPEVLAFINMWGAGYLHRYDEAAMTEGRYGFASPRTWEFWSQQYNPDAPKWMRDNITIGILGKQTGLPLIGFISMVDQLPNASDIIAGNPYKWNPSTDRGTTLMMLTILIARLKELFDDLRDSIDGAEDVKRAVLCDSHPKEWKIAVDAVFGFMNRHVNPEARASGYFMLLRIAKIPGRVFHGSEHSTFAHESGTIIEEIRNLA